MIHKSHRLESSVPGLDHSFILTESECIRLFQELRKVLDENRNLGTLQELHTLLVSRNIPR